MRLSPRGVDHLRAWEGVRYKPYKDVAGLLTIGVGHLLTKSELASGELNINGRQVQYEAGPLSDESVNALLRQDLVLSESAVNSLVKVPLTQGQFDALVSFVFNIGSSAFRKSTLLRELNLGRYDAVPEQLRLWRRAGGKVVRGLQNRREAEVALWLTQDVGQSEPSEEREAEAPEPVAKQSWLQSLLARWRA